MTIVAKIKVSTVRQNGAETEIVLLRDRMDRAVRIDLANSAVEIIIDPEIAGLIRRELER